MGFEMILLFALGFLLLGPVKMSKLARELGQRTAQLRRASSSLQAQFALEAALAPDTIPDPAIEAQRQIIVGELASMQSNLAAGLTGEA
jgi:Sec-independent protein translocase protein TatA